MAKKKKWAIVIPGGKKLRIIGDKNIEWVYSKREALGTASWFNGVVVDAELLANAKTRDKCLRDAGLGQYAKKKKSS